MTKDDSYGGLRKGLLEVAVLSVVSAQEVYAADILEHLHGTEFETGEGTLYPLLSRLKREGLLEYSWAESTSGPPRKYYGLTARGTQRLADTKTYLHELTSTLRTLGGNNA